MSSAPETVRIIRVFVSSPGDVKDERDAVKEIVDSINRTDGDAQGFRLDLVRWEDYAPRIGPKPQQAVDAQTPVYDIYLGIMSTRFGRPAGRYGSGTEKEFKDALKNWKTAGSPWITFYFDDQPELTGDPDLAGQYHKVCKFRKSLEKQGLYATYRDVRGSPDGFYEKVAEHLRKIVRSCLAQPETPATGKPAATGPAKLAAPEYIQWLRERCGEVELMGLELKHGSGVRLNHVYTPLATSSGPARGASKRPASKERLPEQDRESTQLLLRLLDEQSLCISGDPGSGKSTFCRWVTWLTCNGEMPEVDVPAPDAYREPFPRSLRGRLPILVRLRDFWQHLPAGHVRSIGLGGLEQALRHWLADQKYPGMDWACLKAHLDHGSALLIFDGVDEVPSIREAHAEEWYPREMLLAGLAEGLAYWTKAGNRVLVTSRPYGLSGEQLRRLGLFHAPILGLDQPLQELLVRRWFVRLKEGCQLGLETADAMLNHIHVERKLEDLAANPLLLTAMCIIYDEGKRLPHDKYTLYDRIVDTVLYKRYSVKERIEPIRARLAVVALGMHTGEGLGQQRATPEAAASDGEIDLLLQAYHQLDGSTDRGLSDTVRVREDLLSQSGLLVAAGDDKASFYHLSIQEFLAAERVYLLHVLRRVQLIDFVAEHGSSPGWRNTLAFLFGCLVAKSSPYAGIEHLQAVSQRLKLPAVDPSRRGSSGGAWNLAILLGDCLEILKGREAAIPENLARLFECCALEAFEQEIAVKDRHALSLALGRLGDPRIVADLRVTTHPDEHRGYVRIPAGRYYVGDKKEAVDLDETFWLLKYPVTNSQYALFLGEGGYTAKDLWSADGWQWLQEEQVESPMYWRDPVFNAPNQPVVGVSWWEAEAFCKWAGGFLPSERQWEAAARGPHGFAYPWGDAWEDGICNSLEAGLGCTSAVGVFPRDRSDCTGIMDMAGNVWEWCQDVEASFRVFRGGSWGSGARGCRAALRSRSGSLPFVSLGFRVAAVPPSTR